MPPCSFYKFSPAGNSTLFLIQNGQLDRNALRQALGPDGIGAEQAGIANLEQWSLEMAGGEFCANACRAMGALVDLNLSSGRREEVRNYEITVSGQHDPVSLTVRGALPEWKVAIRLQTASWESCKKDNFQIVSLPGIVHVFFECPELPDPELAPDLAKKAGAAIPEIGAFPAFGMVWWRKTASGHEILPFVTVPEAGTAMLESSCGSASMALAFALGSSGCLNELDVLQPSGKKLRCTLDADSKNIILDGPVNLCATGQFWPQ